MNFYELKIIEYDKVNIEETLKEIKEKINGEENIKANVYLAGNDRHFMMYPDKYADDNKLPSLKIGETEFKGLIDLNPLMPFTLKGYTDEIVIDTINGTKHIDIKYPFLGKEYNVFVTAKDSLIAELRVENEDEKGFDIIAFNSEGFVEMNEKLDCSQTPLRVEYVVIYE